ncbi:carboxypeptidase C [Phakopsora pachyrhizi]|nr:carboxypeptidase C [Phakopsora pachyrhizi]
MGGNKKMILSGLTGMALSLLGNVIAGSQSQIAFSQRPNSSPESLTISSTSVNGLNFERVTMAELPEYAMRVRSPEGLYDPGVKQYSGYLDISETKHLFFWFFESRNKPESDPLVLWLNGGPGCSSSTGLLFELGPCSAQTNGEGTKLNPHAWNSKASMIFLDQPVDVGYSYSEGGSDSISNSADAARDVYAFLQLFYARFPEYLKLKFNVAAESYGGQYAPNIASRIMKENQALTGAAEFGFSSDAVVIPLSTVMIGNGLTDPLIQFASVPDYACAPSPYAIFDESSCNSIRSKVATCQRLQKFCYDSPSRFSCVPATLYCWSSIYGPLQQSGRNPYDVRQKCDQSKNPLCYEQMNWIESYLNRPDVRSELGVPDHMEFQSCNNDVNRAFQMSGDNMHNAAALIPDLLANGIRLLIYAGEDDFMCNYLGNERWMMALDTPFQEEFQNQTHKYLSKHSSGNRTEVSGTHNHVGMLRTAGPGAGNFSYVSLYESGHMVPFDQPEIALELINKWLDNKPLN